MTTAEAYSAEWNYRYRERLGLMLDSTAEPTREQKDLAAKWADETTPRMMSYA